eukprot:TRINITY_DN82355_c0_g1_i1.p1 TRINITY_DN82355_c0_g1~~TRINITY_DN82355_c0_g1_i1.p1  ORF type:complete len:235 (+),score=57.49 TRINITY_DN82355_c0_g1_i1:62-766(+)
MRPPSKRQRLDDDAADEATATQASSSHGRGINPGASVREDVGDQTDVLRVYKNSGLEAKPPKAQAPQGRRQQFRERVDSSVRAMMEGFASIIEAAKSGSRAEVAVNEYAYRANLAAMARAAEDLERLAGEIGSAQAATDLKGRQSELSQQQHLQQKVLDAASNELASVSRSSGFPDGAWLVARKDDSLPPPFTKASAGTSSQQSDGAQQKRFVPYWGQETFRQGGNERVGGGIL